MIGRLFRTHDAVADFIRQATEFGWVVGLSLRSRCRR